MDRLRARALLGGQRIELSDSGRQTHSRSLVNGVRVAHSAALARLEDARLEPALAQVRMMYDQRIRSYKRGASV
jgi:hypothetical protein